MTDPAATAAALMARAERLLLDVRTARVELAGAAESAERTAYLALLESFERGLLAALEDVIAELKSFRGDPVGTAWLRRMLGDLKRGADGLWPRKRRRRGRAKGIWCQRSMRA